MTLPPALDPRLEAAFRLYPPCDMGADIGCDHGRLPLHLLLKNRCANMILTDISPSALSKGQALISRYQLNHRAQCLVGDGLAPLPQKVDAISILGMGGHTICQILQSHPEKLQGAALILSAHTQGDQMRSILPTLGYAIEKEEAVQAAGRYYVLIKALPGRVTYSQKQLLLGPRLLENKTPATLAYWQWQHSVFSKALKGSQQGSPANENEELLAKAYLAFLEEELP